MHQHADTRTHCNRKYTNHQIWGGHKVIAGRDVGDPWHRPGRSLAPDSGRGCERLWGVHFLEDERVVGWRVARQGWEPGRRHGCGWGDVEVDRVCSYRRSPILNNVGDQPGRSSGGPAGNPITNRCQLVSMRWRAVERLNSPGSHRLVVTCEYPEERSLQAEKRCTRGAPPGDPPGDLRSGFLSPILPQILAPIEAPCEGTSQRQVPSDMIGCIAASAAAVQQGQARPDKQS